MSLCALCDPISAVQKLRRSSKRASRGKDELSQSLQCNGENVRNVKIQNQYVKQLKCKS